MVQKSDFLGNVSKFVLLVQTESQFAGDGSRRPRLQVHLLPHHLQVVRVLLLIGLNVLFLSFVLRRLQLASSLQVDVSDFLPLVHLLQLSLHKVFLTFRPEDYLRLVVDLGGLLEGVFDEIRVLVFLTDSLQDFLLPLPLFEEELRVAQRLFLQVSSKPLHQRNQLAPTVLLFVDFVEVSLIPDYFSEIALLRKDAEFLEVHFLPGALALLYRQIQFPLLDESLVLVLQFVSLIKRKLLVPLVDRPQLQNLFVGVSTDFDHLTASLGLCETGNWLDKLAFTLLDH